VCTEVIKKGKMSYLDTIRDDTKQSPTARLFVHIACGGAVLGCMAATSFSLQPFIDNSNARWAPASIFFHCFIFPGTLGALYTWNLYMLKDQVMPPSFKLGFLIAEIGADFAIMGVSAQNPVFACGLSGCTYDVLPPVTMADQLVQTWDPPSGTAVMALMYFTLSLALLPLLLWQAYQQWLSYQASIAFLRSSPPGKSKLKLATPMKEVIDSDADTDIGIEMHPMQSNPMYAVKPVLSKSGGGRTVATRGNDGPSAGRLGEDVNSTAEPEGRRRGGKSTKANSKQEKDKVVAKLYLPWQQHLSDIERKRWWSWAYILGALLLLWPINLFCTSRFGNDFQWFSNYGIAAWAKHIIKPPIPQITISELLNYKFFPQIIIFYCYIYGIVVVALLAKMFPRLRKFFAWRPTAFNTLPFMDSCTMGEFLMAALFIIFTLATFSYTFWDWYGIPHVKWKGAPLTERWGRCLGQSSLFPMGVMILPVSRNSIWSKLLDYPWDGMIKFHKWMSITFLAISTGHMIAFWFCFKSLHIFPEAIFKSPNAYSPEDATIGMMSGLVFFVLLPVFGILTLDWVRRSQFELFYYTHMLSSVVFLATLWHADFAWMYLIPGLTMWLVDHCLRLSNSVRNYEVVGLRDVGDNIVELEFGMKRTPYASLDALPFESAQYVFVNIPDISPLQSHPFNISGSPFDKANVLHIKSRGVGTWTGDLLDFARMVTKTNEQAEAHPGATKPFPLLRLGITIDGPYGTGLPWMRCTNILLIGGGIGVTPLHSVLRSVLLLYHNKKIMPFGCKLGKVRLVWTFRNEDIIAKNSMFMDTLRMVPACKDAEALLAAADVGLGGNAWPFSTSKGAKGQPMSMSAEKTPKAKHSSSNSMSKSSSTRSQVAPAGLVGKTLYADASSSGSDDEVDTDIGADLADLNGIDLSDNRRTLPSKHSGGSMNVNQTTPKKHDSHKKGGAGASSGVSPARPASGGDGSPRDIVFEVSLHCTATPASKAFAFLPSKSASAAVTQLTMDAASMERGILRFPHPIIHARPDIRTEVAALANDSDALCFCVGPDALVSSVRAACSEHGVEFRGENADL